MRFQDLTPAQQQLVQTDFGDMDKVAAAAVEHVTDCYQYGYDKIANEIIETLDKVAAEEEKEKEDEKKELDEKREKTASEGGAFIERGVFDRLVKEGSERHGDPLHYFYPYMEQKIAEEGARAALEKAASRMENLRKGVAAAGKKVGDTAGAVVTHAKATAGHAREALTGRNAFMDRVGAKGRMNMAQRAEPAKKALKGAVPYAAGAAVTTGGAGAVNHFLKKKKKEEEPAAS